MYVHQSDATFLLREREGELSGAREELHCLRRRLVLAHEAERRRLARELHDDAMQRLAAVALQLDDLQHRPHSDPDTRRRLERVAGDVNAVVQAVRDLSHSMHATGLHHAGLIATLRLMGDEFSRRSGIVVETRLPATDPPIGDDAALAVYRITQEALANVARHARARRVTIELHTGDGRLSLVVVDDGRGFDPPRSPGQGLGLLSMGERARLADGRFAIDSAVGAGTRIEVSLPAGGRLGPRALEPRE
jgi:signal transduction histidine kinase